MSVSFSSLPSSPSNFSNTLPRNMSGIIDSVGTSVPVVSISSQDPSNDSSHLKSTSEGQDPRWIPFLTEWASTQPDNCCICLDTGSNEGNELLLCASPACDVCVHEECYGLEGDSITEIPWYCDRCRSPNSSEIKCSLCPIKGGAMKQTNHLDTWVHVVCALWFPEIDIADSDHLRGISLSRVKQDRFGRQCSICTNPSDTALGACLTCDSNGCGKSFHATCAQAWDLLEEVVDTSKLNPGQEPYFSFCKEHGFRAVPQMNPWAEWSRKLADFEQTYGNPPPSLNNLLDSELRQIKPKAYRPKIRRVNGQSIEDRKAAEAQSGPGIYERVSTPNSDCGPRQVNSLDMLLEASKHMSGVSSSPHAGRRVGLLEKFEHQYALFQEERQYAMHCLEQTHGRQSEMLRSLHDSINQMDRAKTRIQSKYAALEQENRGLNMILNEMRDALTNLYDSGGLEVLESTLEDLPSISGHGQSKEDIIEKFLKFSPELPSMTTFINRNPSRWSFSNQISSALNCRACNLPINPRVDGQLATCRACQAHYHLGCENHTMLRVDGPVWSCLECRTENIALHPTRAKEQLSGFGLLHGSISPHHNRILTGEDLEFKKRPPRKRSLSSPPANSMSSSKIFQKTAEYSPVKRNSPEPNRRAKSKRAKKSVKPTPQSPLVTALINQTLLNLSPTMPRVEYKPNLTVPEDSKKDIILTDDEKHPKIKSSADSLISSNQSSPRLENSVHSPLLQDLGKSTTPLRSDAGEPSDNDIPPALLEADKPKPHRQPPRFEGDIYTPLWVRGVGKAKEGLCPLCKDRCLWLKIKTSAYWYHLNYQHGISSNTGRPFASPVETRIHAVTGLKEALCHKCGQWVAYESPRNSKSGSLEDAYWWRHAQKCHQ